MSIDGAARGAAGSRLAPPCSMLGQGHGVTCQLGCASKWGGRRLGPQAPRPRPAQRYALFHTHHINRHTSALPLPGRAPSMREPTVDIMRSMRSGASGRGPCSDSTREGHNGRHGLKGAETLV